MIILDNNYHFLEYTRRDSQGYNNFYFIPQPTIVDQIKGVDYISGSLPSLLFGEIFTDAEVVFGMSAINKNNIQNVMAKRILWSTPQKVYLYDGGTTTQYNNSEMIQSLLDHKLSSTPFSPSNAFENYSDLDRLIYIYLDAVVNNTFNHFLNDFPTEYNTDLEYLFAVYINNELYNLKKNNEVYPV